MSGCSVGKCRRDACWFVRFTGQRRVYGYCGWHAMGRFGPRWKRSQIAEMWSEGVATRHDNW